MTSAIESLQKSIEELGEESYHVMSGFHTDIYLDPQKQTVYTFVTNNARPMDAHHGIDIHVAKVRDRAIPETVVAAVNSVTDDLEFLLDKFSGTEWDGNNHKGRYSMDEDDWQSTYYRFNEAAQEIGYYWDADEWFQLSPSEIKEIHDQHEAGKTIEEIVEQQNLGGGSDGGVTQEDAIKFFQELIDSYEETEGEE